MSACRLHLRRWLPSAAVLALCAAFANALPWPLLWEGIRRASVPLLIIALLAQSVGMAVRTLMWRGFLREVGAPSLSLAARAMIVGMALHCVLVGNAGEAGRVIVVVRGSRASTASVVATVVLERLMVTAGFGILLLFAGAMLPLPATLARARIPLLAALLVAGAVLALLARAPQRQAPPSRRAPLGRVRKAARAFLATVRRIGSARRLSAAMGLSAVNWVMQITAIHFTARAVEYPISLGESVIALLAVSAGGSVRATPGNIGVTQIAYAATAAMLGLPAKEAVGAALLLQAVQTLPVLAGLLALLSASICTCRVARRLRLGVPPLDSGGGLHRLRL